ncbi:MAG: hypothetical protein K2G62_01980, partial [Oscillospiraceae bacterium]|nr:hypothetical protein [Oscillospiraceae bacterium]
VEAYEIMPVALVVAEEKVLAVYGTVVFPLWFCFLDGFPFRVVVTRERNLVAAQIFKYCFFSRHDAWNVFICKFTCFL